MIQVTIQEAKANLFQLIQEALSGEEIIITNDQQPLVKLTTLLQTKPPRTIGLAKGIIHYMADDFNDPLPEFQEYMNESAP